MYFKCLFVFIFYYFKVLSIYLQCIKIHLIYLHCIKIHHIYLQCIKIHNIYLQCIKIHHIYLQCIKIHHIYTITVQTNAYILTTWLFTPRPLCTKGTDLVSCCIVLVWFLDDDFLRTETCANIQWYTYCNTNIYGTCFVHFVGSVSWISTQ